MLWSGDVGTDGWNHNTHYHEHLLAELPRPCHRVLDVGCGRGSFARRLATIATHVDAVDIDFPTLERARLEGRGFSNVLCARSDFFGWDSPEPYDAITMVATLHHLPFDAAVTRAASLLRPGGSLIVLGLDRAPSFLARAVSGVIGMPVSWFYRATRRTADVGAPIREPEMTLGEIRARAATLLPGARISACVLFRYVLVWRRPAAAALPMEAAGS